MARGDGVSIWWCPRRDSNSRTWFRKPRREVQIPPDGTPHVDQRRVPLAIVWKLDKPADDLPDSVSGNNPALRSAPTRSVPMRATSLGRSPRWPTASDCRAPPTADRRGRRHGSGRRWDDQPRRRPSPFTEDRWFRGAVGEVARPPPRMIEAMRTGSWSLVAVNVASPIVSRRSVSFRSLRTRRSYGGWSVT